LPPRNVGLVPRGTKPHLQHPRPTHNLQTISAHGPKPAPTTPHPAPNPPTPTPPQQADPAPRRHVAVDRPDHPHRVHGGAARGHGAVQNLHHLPGWGGGAGGRGGTGEAGGGGWRGAGLKWHQIAPGGTVAAPNGSPSKRLRVRAASGGPAGVCRVLRWPAPAGARLHPQSKPAPKRPTNAPKRPQTSGRSLHPLRPRARAGAAGGADRWGGTRGPEGVKAWSKLAKAGPKAGQSAPTQAKHSVAGVGTGPRLWRSFILAPPPLPRKTPPPTTPFPPQQPIPLPTPPPRAPPPPH
jgi:hypothetical protein